MQNLDVSLADGFYLVSLLFGLLVIVIKTTLYRILEYTVREGGCSRWGIVGRKLPSFHSVRATTAQRDREPLLACLSPVGRSTFLGLSESRGSLLMINVE